MGTARAEGTDHTQEGGADRPASACPRQAAPARGILGLQRMAGNAAVVRLLAGRSSPGRDVAGGVLGTAGPAFVQRSLASVEADNVPTPAEAVKRATGVPISGQLLPGGKVQPASNVARPKRVRAQVSKGTLPATDRANDGILSKVTAMARAEQRILQGTDMQKFYDAGHLVGDQLVAGDGTDSFQYWNLAPQVSPFNTPAYSAVEDQIKTMAGSATMDMEVTLQYPADYAVKIAHLKQRGIVTKSTGADTTDVPIHRRIPTSWNLHAEVSGAPGSRVPGPARRLGSQQPPSLGQPFARDVRQVGAQQGGPTSPASLVGHSVTGMQWSPSTSIQGSDILSILAKTFEDLGSPDDIAARILTKEHTVNRSSAVRLIKQAAGEVALAQVDLANRLSELMDPSVMQEYLKVSDPSIRAHLNTARDESTELGMAVHHLVTAKGWVDALLEKATEIRGEQREQYFFTLEQQRSALVDLRGKYQTDIPYPRGGELLMTSFGPPGLLHGQSVLLDGNLIARVEDVTKEVTLEGMATGRWHIKYLHFSDPQPPD